MSEITGKEENKPSYNWKFDRNNTFCISLESATGRRQRMEERFGYFGMDVYFFCAACTTEEFVGPFADYLSHGQRGCAQSHFNVWKHIVENQIPYALVLEDDAMFDKDWRRKLDEVYELTQGKGGTWDAIFLNCSEPIVPKDIWCKVTDQYLTGAYVVSLQGAGTLLAIVRDWFSGTLYGCDWTTTRLQSCENSWSYFPWLVIQEGRDSTIGSGFEADYAKVVRCLGAIGYNISENYI